MLDIDYTKSIDNYKEYIFEYFLNKGYTIDVYFSTNILSEDDKKDLS